MAIQQALDLRPLNPRPWQRDGSELRRIWYFVFYLAVACVCALAVIVCMADKQREGAGCIETACSACCCSTCLFLLAMFFFSLTMTAGRYLATWCLGLIWYVCKRARRVIIKFGSLNEIWWRLSTSCSGSCYRT